MLRRVWAPWRSPAARADVKRKHFKIRLLPGNEEIMGFQTLAARCQYFNDQKQDRHDYGSERQNLSGRNRFHLHTVEAIKGPQSASQDKLAANVALICTESK